MAITYHEPAIQFFPAALKHYVRIARRFAWKRRASFAGVGAPRPDDDAKMFDRSAFELASALRR